MPEKLSQSWGIPFARVVLAVALLPVLTVGMIVWHECGHTVAAWLVGDPSARFHLIVQTPQERCIGCNLYDSAALSPARNAMVNAAGVGATQLLAWTAATAWGWRARPQWLPRWLLGEVLVLTVLGDLVFQVVQGVAAGVPAQEPVARRASYIDASAVVSFGSRASGQTHQHLAWLLLALAGLHVLALMATLVGFRVARAHRRPQGEPEPR